MRAKRAKPHLLISGAGPAGLALAYYLKQHNIPFIIMERDLEENSRPPGFAFNITRKGQEAMRKMGLLDVLVERSNLLTDGFRFVDENLQLLKHILPEPAAMEIARGGLRRLLLEVVGECNIQWGLRIVSLSRARDGLDTVVKFLQATQDGEEMHGEGTFCAVIGADGMNSVVRDILFGDSAQPYGLVGVYGLTKDYRNDDGEWKYGIHQYEIVKDQKRIFSKPFDHLSLESPKYNWQITFAHVGSDVPSPAIGLEMAKDAVADWGEDVQDMIGSTDPADVMTRVLYYKNHIEKLPNDLPVTLIGDAYHSVVPFSGPQGVNNALEDAAVLGIEIVKHWPNVVLALRSYEEIVRKDREGLINESNEAARTTFGLTLTPPENIAPARISDAYQ